MRVKLKTLNSSQVEIWRVDLFLTRIFFLSQYHVLYCLKINKKNFSPENLIQHIENSADPFFANASRQGMLVSWPSVSLGE